MEVEPDERLAILSAASVDSTRCGPCAIIVRTREEFLSALQAPPPGAEWLQVEGLLGDAEVWAIAAHGPVTIPLDVIVSDPAGEFSSLYRLADVRLVRDVRVTMPVMPGCMKALRLASSLQLPTRLLPGQPSVESLNELSHAVDFYLHDPMVDAPIEFLHSLFAVFLGTEEGTLWTFLEEDPDVFRRHAGDGQEVIPRNFVANHLAQLVEHEAECVTCRWQTVCEGYFKWPDPAYSCAGVKEIFAVLEAAAEEIRHDLTGQKATTAS